MKLINFRCSIALLLGVLLTMTTMSCQDDELVNQGDYVVEGLPATLDLKLNLSDMTQMTRAIIDDERTYQCSNLWVGIYSTTGNKACVFDSIFTDVSGNAEEIGNMYKLAIVLQDIQTKSGSVYIVAAANVNSVYAIPTPTSSVDDAELLGNLLKKADTWDKFTSICATRGDDTDIYQMSYELPMSGFYSADTNITDTNLDPDIYNLKNIEAVTLTPGQNTLPGVVKLRRMISYNKFNISAGPNVTLKLVSWQVFNNPYYCYVIDSEKNAGDATVASDGTSTAYNPSVKSTTFTSGDNDSHEFEFYQFENKHTACTYDGATDWVGIRNPQQTTVTTDDMYNDREREYKSYNSSTGYYDNSGIYKSLVENQSNLTNNFASYVVLTAQVSYYVTKPTAAQISADDGDSTLKDALPQPYDEANKDNLIYRTAEVKYVIHLGYCEGKEGTDPTYTTAQDFNCRRNSKYTYNVTINGVKNIVVEAHRDSETQPGAEGTVYDAYADYVQLDAHYNTFNISLTNNERSTLRYHVVAPYNGSNNYIYSENLTTEDAIAEAKKNQFYKWITFRPTTSKDVLARYPGEGSDKLWTLNELSDYVNHPHSENLETDGTTTDTTVDDETEQWYTVFIDENVYHDGEVYHEATNSYTESNWVNYVNQDDRKVELIVRSKESWDNQSEYLLCKYAFSQRSIQSYYKMVDVAKASAPATRAEEHDTDTALGLEHTNESFCLNMRWDSNDSIQSTNNGRYNLHNACKLMNKEWASVIQETVPATVEEGTCSNTKWSHEAAEYPVPQLKVALTSTTHNGYDPTPSDNNFYYVNTACMNRNRDLNGDGVIDESEMKWYNPTYDEYVQIQIGLSGLVNPLIDWNKYAVDRYYVSRAYEDKEFLHFACSDNKVIWAEEGFSIGRGIYTDGGILYPYEIRCARHLGGNPGNEPTEGIEVQAAYVRRSNDSSSSDYYIIDAPYYTDACIRPYSVAAIGPNDVNSELNRVYRHFQVSKNYCENLGKLDANFQLPGQELMMIVTNQSYQQRSDAWRISLQNNSVCKKYTEEEGGKDLGTWRVPNIKELAMMMLTGFTSEGSFRIPSSTNEYFYHPGFTSDAYESKKAFFGQLSGTQISRSLFQGTGTQYLYTRIRCVRDVKN